MIVFLICLKNRSNCTSLVVNILKLGSITSLVHVYALQLKPTRYNAVSNHNKE